MREQMDLNHELSVLRGREIERLRTALERYADRDNWFRTTHIQDDGFPQPVWAWDTMEEPWEPARRALGAISHLRED